jgi:hypothetical protein
MLRIADRPAAHAGLQLHKFDGDQRRQTIACFPIDYHVRCGLPTTSESAIACRSISKLLHFRHLKSIEFNHDCAFFRAGLPMGLIKLSSYRHGRQISYRCPPQRRQEHSSEVQRSYDSRSELARRNPPREPDCQSRSILPFCGERRAGKALLNEKGRPESRPSPSTKRIDPWARLTPANRGGKSRSAALLLRGLYFKNAPPPSPRLPMKANASHAR